MTSPKGVRVEPVPQRQPVAGSQDCCVDADDCTLAATPPSQSVLHVHWEEFDSCHFYCTSDNSQQYGFARNGATPTFL